MFLCRFWFFVSKNYFCLTSQKCRPIGTQWWYDIYKPCLLISCYLRLQAPPFWNCEVGLLLIKYFCLTSQNVGQSEHSDYVIFTNPIFLSVATWDCRRLHFGIEVGLLLIIYFCLTSHIVGQSEHSDDIYKSCLLISFYLRLQAPQFRNFEVGL